MGACPLLQVERPARRTNLGGVEKLSGSFSRTAGVTFRMEGDQIRLVETASGRSLPRDEEVRLQYEEAEARSRALEEENARLRAELERARKSG